VLNARAVAEQTGLAYEVTPANPAYLSEYARRCVEITEGNLNASAAWIFQEEDHLRGAPASVLLTGVGGEAISSRHLLAGFDARDEQQALNRLFTQVWHYRQAADLLRPNLREALAESQAGVTRTLTESPEGQLSSRFDDFNFRLMRRHPTGNLLNAAVDVYEPYLDNDLVDYCLRLPPELRAGGSLFYLLLERRFARLAAIPGGRSQPARSNFLQSLWRRLRARPAAEDPSRAILHNQWLRTAARPYVTGLLTSELLGEFCDMRAVRHLLNDHMTGRSNAYRLLGALVTFAEWRKQFS
jgi:hypothetical protein